MMAGQQSRGRVTTLEKGFCRQCPDLIPRNELGRRLHKEGRIWDAVV